MPARESLTEARVSGVMAPTPDAVAEREWGVCAPEAAELACMEIPPGEREDRMEADPCGPPTMLGTGTPGTPPCGPPRLL
jgi:hypothetical protein